MDDALLCYAHLARSSSLPNPGETHTLRELLSPFDAHFQPYGLYNDCKRLAKKYERKVVPDRFAPNFCVLLGMERLGHEFLAKFDIKFCHVTRKIGRPQERAELSFAKFGVTDGRVELIAYGQRFCRCWLSLAL
jgi:hypothetical protein